MLIRNMALRRGGMHAQEVSKICLTSGRYESRFMLDDNAPTQNAVRLCSLLPVVLSPTR
jgi:hypothetical protein